MAYPWLAEEPRAGTDAGECAGSARRDLSRRYARRVQREGTRGCILKAAAVELGSQEDTLKRDLGRVLLKLETLQDEAIRATLAPKEKGVALDAVEHAAALEWLKAPDLIARLEADMARCGVVGEATNLLAGYLAAVSRKLDAPLAVLIQERARRARVH